MSTTNPDELLDAFIAQLKVYKQNFTNQVNATFTRLTPQDVIRLVIIAGAYCLLRPYLIKLGGRFQAADHEREIDHEEIANMRKNEGYNKDNALKGVEIPSDTDSEDDQATVKTGTDWGKKARRRQRRVMRALLEAEEKKRLEDEEAESDKELEEFMVR